MMKNNKKGQAAMEFLMTYGWAILVVLAAIGALAYFGVLSPDRFLPDKCTANPPFACTQYKISDAAGTLTFDLQNSAGVDITINDVLLSCGGTGVSATTPAMPVDTIVKNGEQITLVWTEASVTAAGVDCNPLTDGTKFKATYDITYTKTGSGETVDHTGTGSIQVRVEA